MRPAQLAPGIDGAMARDNLDAIVAPHLTNSTGSRGGRLSEFSMPVGIRTSGRPAGMLMYSTFLHEPQLLAMAYDLEQALNRAAATAIPRLDHSDSERGSVQQAAAARQGAPPARADLRST